MKLYHGTNCSSAMNICIEGVKLEKSQPYLDFGAGFYVTPNYQHAAITAIRKTDKFNKKYGTSEEPYIVEVECNFNINKENIIKQFPSHSDEWAEFVLNNRLSDEMLKQYNLTNSNRDKRYDIVYGEVADGKIVNKAYEVNHGLLLPQNVPCMDLLKNGTTYALQYSFHTEKAKSCILSMKCDIIKNKERYIKIMTGNGK